MTNWTKAMANRPQSTPLFCCYNGKAFITILGFLQFIKLHIWRLVCCDNLPWNRLSIMHTSSLLQPNVLTAIQWKPPVCKTWTKGDSLITLNCNASPKTGPCMSFTSGYSRLSIFCKALIISSLSILLFLRATTLSFDIMESILL